MRAEWVGAMVVAGLLGGCVGEPRIYLRPQPEASRLRLTPPARAVQPERPAERITERNAERPPERPARVAAPLSAEEKQRLFRQFEESRASVTDP